MIKVLTNSVASDCPPVCSKALPYYEDIDTIGQMDEAGALIYFVAREFNNRVLSENGFEPIGRVGLLVLSETLTQSYTPTLATQWSASGLAEWIFELEADVADALVRLENHGFLCSEPCKSTKQTPADYRSYVSLMPASLAYLADEPGVLSWTRTVDAATNTTDRNYLTLSALDKEDPL